MGWLNMSLFLALRFHVVPSAPVCVPVITIGTAITLVPIWQEKVFWCSRYKTGRTSFTTPLPLVFIRFYAKSLANVKHCATFALALSHPFEKLLHRVVHFNPCNFRLCLPHSCRHLLPSAGRVFDTVVHCSISVALLFVSLPCVVSVLQ